LEAANSIFVSDKFSVLREYEKKVVRYYKGAIKSLDFSNVNAAVKTINAWVANATHGLIQQVVGNQNIFADTTLVLANALYFKGKWKTEFDPAKTKEKCFHSLTRGCINTPMMQISDMFNYNLNIDLNAHAVELPYQVTIKRHTSRYTIFTFSYRTTNTPCLFCSPLTATT
jgi:serine protease inhibitor